MSASVPGLTMSQRMTLSAVIVESAMVAFADHPKRDAMEAFAWRAMLKATDPAERSAPRVPEQRTDFSTVLYRHFDATGRLIYVGIAFDEHQRRKDHGRLADWFELSESVTHEFYDGRESAEEAERRAIADELPIFNVAQRDVEGRERLVQYLLGIGRLDLLAGRMR